MDTYMRAHPSDFGAGAALRSEEEGLRRVLVRLIGCGDHQLAHLQQVRLRRSRLLLPKPDTLSNHVDPHAVMEDTCLLSMLWVQDTLLLIRALYGNFTTQVRGAFPVARDPLTSCGL